MKNIQQQIDFIVSVRESFDNNERTAIFMKYNPDEIAELLRDINDSLHGVKLHQLNPDVKVCHDCKQPLTPQNKVNFAVNNERITVTRDEDVCDRCAHVRNDNVQNQTVGIP